MADQTKISPFKRIFIIVSGCFFIGSLGSGLVSMFTQGGQDSQAQMATQTASVNEQLEQQALGYEKVLAKEPQNKFALDNLIKIRLEMNDLQGLKSQIENLIKLHPNEPSFKEVIKAIDEDLKAQSSEPSKE